MNYDPAQQRIVQPWARSERILTIVEAVTAITTVDNPISISSWAEAARINRTTLNDYLPDLRAKGWIATTGEGNTARQYLTEKGQLAAKRARMANTTSRIGWCI